MHAAAGVKSTCVMSPDNIWKNDNNNDNHDNDTHFKPSCCGWQGNFSDFLVHLSNIYSLLRGDTSGQKNEDDAQGFVRSTTKYWVRTRLPMAAHGGDATPG